MAQKNIQPILRLLRERPHPGLRNEPPLDCLDPQSLNPFMASLWIGSGEGLAIKGFGDWGSRLSSGGSFWSPGWGRSCSSLEIDWIFFCHFNFPESAVNQLHIRNGNNLTYVLGNRRHPCALNLPFHTGLKWAKSCFESFDSLVVS